MNSDLLKIYAKANLTSFYTYIVIAFIFVGVRIRLYGLPVAPEEFFKEAGRWGLILFAAFLALMKTRDFYRSMLAEKFPLPESGYTGAVLWIAVLKLFYMTFWLYFLFMPLESPYWYQHLLGYLFIFSALGIYATLSSAYLPLFLWDVGIQMGFAFFVLWHHRYAPEAPYLAGALVLFGFYTFLNGLSLTRTTRQLVETGYALKKAADSANRANKSKSEFLAIMSHEIRTPMTGILGMVDFLTETDLSPAQKSSVEAITECSKTLLNTLNDILDLSKIEAGKLAISNINLDLHSVLANAINILKRTAADKNLDLRLDIAPDTPRYIHGDPHRIRQAVMNLINNAIKFTERGTVDVSASFINGFIRIEIRDTGIGISPEKMQHLFKSFTQADSSISRKYGGSGLGLAITKRLVEKMGGKVGLSSVEGRGSAFWFDIPYKEAIPERRDVAKRKEVADMPPQNILLVEDNHINQMVCSRLLTQKGHHVTVAGDGDSALALARDGSYDLILMDCSLPGQNGIDVTRAIRALGGKYRRLPILALTANGMEDHLKKCIDGGMNDVIVKPYEPERLYLAIAAHTGHASPAIGSRGKLKTIEEEMGPEYMAHLVKSSLAEIARLTEEVIQAHKKQDYTALQQAAHDLKAVSGSIDLQRIQLQAETLEKACINKGIASVPTLVEQLLAAVQAEQALKGRA